mgnify:CR=1 FL=1
MRYVERNPVRAKTLKVRKAQRWPWSSVGLKQSNVEYPELDPGPVQRGKHWLDWVNEPQTEDELKALRQSVNRQRPYGSFDWQSSAAVELGLEHALRSRGRPRKAEKK